jgi:hypothetical protein
MRTIFISVRLAIRVWGKPAGLGEHGTFSFSRVVELLRDELQKAGRAAPRK